MIYPVLVLSVALSMYFFTVKFIAKADSDNLDIELKGIDKFLHPGSTMVLNDFYPSPEMYTYKVTYVLAPVKLKSPPGNENDTTLYLLPLNVSDTGVIARLANSYIIWRSKGATIQFILATAKHKHAN